MRGVREAHSSDAPKRSAHPPATRPAVAPAGPASDHSTGATRSVPAGASLLNPASVLRLQRGAGNAATAALVQPSGQGPPGQRTPRVQREPVPETTAASTGGRLTIPATLLGGDHDQVVSDRADAASALSVVAAGLDERASTLDTDGETSLRGMARLTRAEAAKLASPGPLSPGDASYLNGFLTITASGEKQAVDSAVQRLVSLFEQAQPSPDDVTRIEGLEDDVAETLHQRFVARKKDEIKRLIELSEKVKSWNSKVGEYSGKVQEQSKKLEGIKGVADAAERAKQLKGMSKDFGEKVDKAKEILEVANDLATIAGVQGQPDGTEMMKGIAQFSAGIDLVDKSIGKFAEAVPVFKDLWSKWYKPLTDACVKGLVKIAGLMEVKDREDVVGMWNIEDTGGSLARDTNGAPLIPRLYLAKGDFPGGQAVFSYLYCLREGRPTPALSEDVKVFFLERRDIMNEVASAASDEMTADWKLLSPSTWSLKGRETNLVSWLTTHWETAWEMLYGRYGRYVPH